MFGSSETFQNKSRIITRRMFVLSVVKIAVFIAIAIITMALRKKRKRL